MNDSIKKFIQDYRSAFDRATPDAHGWKGLEHALKRYKQGDELERYLLLNRPLLDVETPSECAWEGILVALDTAAPSSNGVQHTQAGAQCDSLEQFVRMNREQLDEVTPDLTVWARIQNALPATERPGGKLRQLSWQRTLLRVAASLTLLLTGIGLGMWYARSDAAMAGMAMSEVSNEYAELEQFYQRDIAGKQVKLASFTGTQAAQVHEDLVQLDDIMEELRKELADVPAANREQVVRAMIENYKAKASILQRVLEHLESSETETNHSGNEHESKTI